MSRARDTANQINRVNSSAADATAITVDSSENVGVGVVPKTWNVYDQALQIGDGAAIWTYQNAEAHYSVNSYYNSGNKYIGTGTALQYEQAAGAHSFKTATSGTADAAISWNTKVNIDSDGLKFHGDTAAANALNDYEEGTWTPLAKGTLTNPSSAPTLIGRYTKIGNQVNIYIKFDAVSFAGASGGVYFDGLPFSASGATVHGIGSVMQYNVCTFNDSPCLYVSGSAVYIYHNVSGSSWDNSAHTGSSQVYMNACATYTTNS